MESNPSDKELLDLVAAGDEAAFRRLFNAYYEQLGNHIFRLTESRVVTEEIVQDAFLKIWLNRESLGGIQHFKAYLFAASRNHAINHLRKLARERGQRRQWERVVVSQTEEMADEREDVYGLLDLAVRQLPPQQRKVYIMSRYDRLKYEDIASRLDLSRETVKKYLQLATASIAAYIRDHMELVVIVLAFLKKK